MTARTTAGLLVAVAAVLAPADSAVAQMNTGMPNALQGFSVNRNQPVHITSKSLEVRDKEKKATFIGDVLVSQGDTTMRSNTLDVFYDQDSAPGQPKAAQAPQVDGGQIRRLEAKGNVVVTKLDQTATGDVGIFDTQANTVTLTGNVVVTQAGNVLRAPRLTVNLTTGESKFEGKVEGLLLPNSRRELKGDSKPGDAKPADPKGGDARPGDTKAADAKPDATRSKDAARPATKSTPGQPLRLNN
jgi:lipopolysaccharide export system protein LptA